VIILGSKNKGNAGTEMHVFMSKLCCLQRSSVRCRNYIVRNELAFVVEIILSIAN